MEKLVFNYNFSRLYRGGEPVSYFYNHKEDRLLLILLEKEKEKQLLNLAAKGISVVIDKELVKLPVPRSWYPYLGRDNFVVYGLSSAIVTEQEIKRFSNRVIVSVEAITLIENMLSYAKEKLSYEDIEVLDSVEDLIFTLISETYITLEVSAAKQQCQFQAEKKIASITQKLQEISEREKQLLEEKNQLQQQLVQLQNKTEEKMKNVVDETVKLIKERINNHYFYNYLCKPIRHYKELKAAINKMIDEIV